MSRAKTGTGDDGGFEIEVGSPIGDDGPSGIGIGDDDHAGDDGSGDDDDKGSGTPGPDGEDRDDGGDDDEAPESLRRKLQAERRAKKALERRQRQMEDALADMAAKSSDEFTRLRNAVISNTSAAVGRGVAEAESRFQAAEQAYEQALVEGDPKAIVAAQKRLNDAQFQLNVERARADGFRQEAEGIRNKPVDLRPQMRQPEEDPDMVALRADWLRRRPWFKPRANEYSVMAEQLSNLLASQGIDPADPEHWAELDRRMAAVAPDLYRQEKAPAPRRNGSVPIVSQPSGRTQGRGNGRGREEITLTPTEIEHWTAANFDVVNNPEHRKRAIEAKRRHLEKKAARAG